MLGNFESPKLELFQTTILIPSFSHHNFQDLSLRTTNLTFWIETKSGTLLCGDPLFEYLNFRNCLFGNICIYSTCIFRFVEI